MNEFRYERAASAADALARIRQPDAMFIAGGTNLLDLMKGGIEAPARLVDVSRLPLARIEPLPDGGLRIGATVRNADAAADRAVRSRYPLLSQAMLAGASAQLRNMATMGGNLMQRTRCYYFYDTGYPACNKRRPGSGCSALDGPNRIHAILGASDSCIATNPSDMNVALAALRATIRVSGPRGERAIAIADFHRLPGDAPQVDTTLAADELITAIDLPPPRHADHSYYLKVRDRSSYAFALISVAAGLEMRDGRVSDAALALGGVAHKPWRVAEAEAALLGTTLDDATIRHACDLVLAGARGYGSNDFKIELARRAIARALRTAAAGTNGAQP